MTATTVGDIVKNSVLCRVHANVIQEELRQRSNKHSAYIERLTPPLSSENTYII
jgi:hypothetical protein